ncbi:Spo0B C-terminal domain-containing protein [Bacillus rubiinfantis]|uniref:Spo0B C-terminal domain-containing protein n=1 Tax=Bacillus rubiinfantis TaxID=1499680 RepID=UPI0005AA4AB0|nr:Spo0B C-terminal domain-containing protein [Bacillus rubiinfantis]
MEKHWDIIEILRYSRHDWMNKLQLIKGNIELNRIDRVKTIIDDIIVEAQNESKLSNLPLTNFVSLLLKANWENYNFKLEYEVLTELNSVKINDALLTTWTKQFFSCIHNAVEEFQDNDLTIVIDPGTSGIRFFFELSGIIINRELIKGFLAEINHSLDIEVKDFSECDLALTVFVPAE